MSFAHSASLFALFDMAPSSPSWQDTDSNTSRECSPRPMAFDPLNMPKPKATSNVDSPLLKLPEDVFKCVMDYLDGSAAWSLKRVCKGMANNTTVNSLLYKYPIKLNDVRELRLGDWKYRSIGMIRWLSFRDSVNDSNRHYVQKLAMSHWASIEDFKWIEENLPALTSLDLSAIKDFVWTPEQTWTWKMLADACPGLFSRLEELEVANWADYTAHARIEYSYSYNDYRFKQKFRISRRRDGGSIAMMVFPKCTKLKMLAIRERYSGFHTWNEWEVHQRVCCLVDGVQQYCSPTMTRLKVHDYAPYRSLFSTDATTWSNLTDVDIGLYSWMEDRRERDVIGPIPYRITQGNHHRDEEEAFDDKTFDTCGRDHMVLGNHVVQGVGATFEDLLQSLQTISKKYPKINMRPIRNLQNIILHPFHLVNVMRRRHHFGQHNHNNAQGHTDPVSNEEVQNALCWLAEKCDWKPILAWDSMMCDVFPANLEPNRMFLPKSDVLSRIGSMVSTLRSLDIPIRISIGDRANTCPSSGLDGSLYFGDFKTFVGEDDDKKEVLLPTQASFNLSTIASMVDELTIQYPVDVPGVSGWLRAAMRPTPAEQALMQREMIGWRRFWSRYAHQFTNLKKLTANVPNDIYEDWGHTALATILQDPRWDMLEVQDHAENLGILGALYPFGSSSLRYSFARKRSRTKFVQRVFFRLDKESLTLVDSTPDMTAKQREVIVISDDAIHQPTLLNRRFWPVKSKSDKPVGEKRKRADINGSSSSSSASSATAVPDKDTDTPSADNDNSVPAKKKQKRTSTSESESVITEEFTDEHVMQVSRQQDLLEHALALAQRGD